LHLDDEERSSERFAPHGELHGDDTLGLHRVAPHAIKHQVDLHELIVFPSELLEDRLQHQVDGKATVDEHPRDWLPVDVTSNIQ
jgi:hypothetical protein